MSFYTKEELGGVGFARFGENVLISRKSSIYNPSHISIGSNVRIDDFCVLSAGEGGIEIGDYVHIAVFCSLIGKGKIVLMDFSGLSSRVSIVSSGDDFSGRFMTNPTVPKEFTNVESADVILERHVIIGAGSIILPGVILEKGVAIGALSLVTKSCAALGVYSGVPLKRIKAREQGFLEMEKMVITEK